jgi:hypothetical protein
MSVRRLVGADTELDVGSIADWDQTVEREESPRRGRR